MSLSPNSNHRWAVVLAGGDGTRLQELIRRAEMLQRRGSLGNTFITIGLVGAFMELLHATVPKITRLLEDSFMNGQIDRLKPELPGTGFKPTHIGHPNRIIWIMYHAYAGDAGNHQLQNL